MPKQKICTLKNAQNFDEKPWKILNKFQRSQLLDTLT